VTEAIQTKKVDIAKKCKWHDDCIACGFYHTKEKMLKPYPPANCLFCTTVFGNSNLFPGHLKIIGNHSIIPIKISRGILHAAEGSAKDII